MTYEESQWLLLKMAPIDLLDAGVPQTFNLKHTILTMCKKMRYACIPNFTLFSSRKGKNGVCLNIHFYHSFYLIFAMLIKFVFERYSVSHIF